MKLQEIRKDSREDGQKKNKQVSKPVRKKMQILNLSVCRGTKGGGREMHSERLSQCI